MKIYSNKLRLFKFIMLLLVLIGFIAFSLYDSILQRSPVGIVGYSIGSLIIGLPTLWLIVKFLTFKPFLEIEDGYLIDRTSIRTMMITIDLIEQARFYKAVFDLEGFPAFHNEISLTIEDGRDKKFYVISMIFLKASIQELKDDFERNGIKIVVDETSLKSANDVHKSDFGGNITIGNKDDKNAIT